MPTRKQRNQGGRVLAQAVTAALKQAPAEPPPLDRLEAEAFDGFGAMNTEVLHFGGGILRVPPSGGTLASTSPAGKAVRRCRTPRHARQYSTATNPV